MRLILQQAVISAIVLLYSLNFGEKGTSTILTHPHTLLGEIGGRGGGGGPSSVDRDGTIYVIAKGKGRGLVKVQSTILYINSLLNVFLTIP